ncbi:MAG: hypothetical protein ACLFR7_00080 [Opitutales bacterium]
MIFYIAFVALSLLGFAAIELSDSFAERGTRERPLHRYTPVRKAPHLAAARPALPSTATARSGARRPARNAPTPRRPASVLKV